MMPMGHEAHSVRGRAGPDVDVEEKKESVDLSDLCEDGRLGVTPAQVALAWLLHLAPTVLLIPGTSSLAHLKENLAVGDLVLSDEALAALPG
jgi:aryl-alcohol dehydrogenase-like predicted oxidoreductase